MKSHIKTVKGLSIAVICISAVTITTAIFVATNYSYFIDYYSSSSNYYGSSYTFELEILQVLFGLTIWVLLSSIFSLITGIITLTKTRNATNLSVPFGLTIAACVCAFTSGRVICGVLLVLVAVYIDKTKNELSRPQVYPSSVLGEQPQQIYGYGFNAPQHYQTSQVINNSQGLHNPQNAQPMQYPQNIQNPQDMSYSQSPQSTQSVQDPTTTPYPQAPQNTVH